MQTGEKTDESIGLIEKPKQKTCVKCNVELGKFNSSIESNTCRSCYNKKYSKRFTEKYSIELSLPEDKKPEERPEEKPKEQPEKKEEVKESAPMTKKKDLQRRNNSEKKKEIFESKKPKENEIKIPTMKAGPYDLEINQGEVKCPKDRMPKNPDLSCINVCRAMKFLDITTDKEFIKCMKTY
jgi:hypothetical protein